MNKHEIIQLAKNTINSELKSVEHLKSNLDDEFAQVVTLIKKSHGRVIITGIGKSANIANKIVATLNSTGTYAIFMHAADAIHGDLGMIRENDVIICISKSGNTPEIKVLIPLIKKLGNTIVGLVSEKKSYVAKEADYLLKAYIEREACPFNLAPTNSTTAQLVLGDALAICLLQCSNFSKKDFAKVHPGGTIGKKIYTTVKDLMTCEERPTVYLATNIRKIILEISSKRLGATAVVNKEEKLLGIITDGDLRRMLELHTDIDSLSAIDIMTKNPKQIYPTALAIKAFQLMEKNSITQLPVTDRKQKKYIGMIHLHDILKEGIM